MAVLSRAYGCCDQASRSGHDAVNTRSRAVYKSCDFDPLQTSLEILVTVDKSDNDKPRSQMINLEDARNPVKELIENALSSFACEQSGVTWCTFALYACPWSGWITTSFDTAAKSDQILAKFGKNGPDWYGEDAWGRFNNNCPDFQFPDWRGLELPHWQTEYEEAEPIHVRDLSGQDHFIGDENEAINGLAFDFLRTVLLDQLRSMNKSRLFPSARHRFGVQLLDSEFAQFWRSQDIES